MKDKVKEEVLKLIKYYDLKCEVKDFAAMADWYSICVNHRTLSEDFIEEFKDYVRWDCVSYYQVLSDDFIKKFLHRIDWFYICERQCLSEDVILEFLNNCTTHLPYTISKHQKLSIEFVRKNFNLLNSSGLLASKNFNLLQKAEIAFKGFYKDIKSIFGITKTNFDIKGDFHFRFIVFTALSLLTYFSMFILVNKPLLYFLLSLVLLVGFEIKIQMENKIKELFGLVGRQLKTVFKAFKAFNMFLIKPESSPERAGDDLRFESSYEVKYYAPNKDDGKSQKGKTVKAKGGAKEGAKGAVKGVAKSAAKPRKRSSKPKNPSKLKKPSKEVA